MTVIVHCGKLPRSGLEWEGTHAMSDTAERGAHERPAGIKDIALALGVSIGTVDRALHGRPGINAMTRARVLKMAQTMGYRPNFAARHLKLNRKLQISVHLPREIASFFDALREGIEEAAAPFESSIRIQFRSYPHLGEKDVELFEEALAEETQGIILAPGHPADLKPWIRKAARRHIPVVCVATDAPGTERLCTISSDAASGGALVAELLTRFVEEARTGADRHRRFEHGGPCGQGARISRVPGDAKESAQDCGGARSARRRRRGISSDTRGAGEAHQTGGGLRGDGKLGAGGAGA